VKGFGCACSSRAWRKVACKSIVDEKALRELLRAVKNFGYCKLRSRACPMSGYKGWDSLNINCWIMAGKRMGSCLRMDSETVSEVRAPTWVRGGTGIPKGQRYQGGGVAAVVVAAGGRLIASFLSTN